MVNQDLMYAYKVNEEGYIIDALLVNPNDTLDDSIVITPIPPGLFEPVWVNGKWISSMTEEEFVKKQQEYESANKPDNIILGQQLTERELEAMVQGQQITDLELRMLMIEMGANK